VQVDVDGNDVVVKGPKGTLKRSFRPEMRLVKEGGTLKIERPRMNPRCARSTG